MKAATHLVRAIELVCWVVGLSLLAIYSAVRAMDEAGRRSDLASFAETRTVRGGDNAVTDPARSADLRPNQALWSQVRVRDYERSIAVDLGRPLAVLAIPAIDLRVPVYDGTDDVILNRGTARIARTALPGKGGNLGIAGHRDGYFRALKDIRRGDLIYVESADRDFEYRVQTIEIVAISTLSVLADTEEPSITLVTCYPFYYLGDAPQRFIVHGVLERSFQPTSTGT